MLTSESDLALRVFPEMERSRRIGLIAGWGQYPVIVAETLRNQGYHVYGVCIKGHADPAIHPLCQKHIYTGLGKLGKQIRFFRKHGVRQLTMAGKIHKSLLFQRYFLLSDLPDLVCIRAFYPHFISGSRDRKDDSLLGTLVNTFSKYGIAVVPATDFAPDLLVKLGQLSGKRLSISQRRDVEFGWHLAKGIGALDVGQSVVVKGRAVLAVEAVEGTDECIRRAGQLCVAGGFTVVKVAKPQQDMRFDVPTVGLETIRTIAQSGGRVLAVEANKTIIIDQPKVVQFAAENAISIVAVDESQVTQNVAA